MISNELMVSVKMITYKHEKFIKQAIEGVLMQETDFEFNLIIADDCSPDNTHEIVNKIIKNHSKGFKIKYFRHEKNIGMYDNGLFAINKCKGKYIALCEGDDYWTDPLKLQKQLEFLEKDKEYSMVFTPALKKFENANKPNKIRNRYFNYNSDDFQLENILKLGGGFYPTCSAMFLNKIFDINNSMKYLKIHSTGDYPIAILAAIKGKIGYIDDVTSVYRVQDNSVSNKLFKTCEDCVKDVKIKYEKNINFLIFLFKEIKIKRKLERELLSKENYILLSKNLNCGHYSGFINLFFKLNLSLKHRIKIIVKLIYLLINGNKASKIQKDN
ncbi:glycosyltransferase [Flavobacteriaceae bacterium]|jgi:glycosyltransferase involved in cell wall biosynthesis|nr:glycosyltransferase [Flavobacteriaceae bacterium]